MMYRRSNVAPHVCDAGAARDDHRRAPVPHGRPHEAHLDRRLRAQGQRSAVRAHRGNHIVSIRSDGRDVARLRTWIGRLVPVRITASNTRAPVGALQQSKRCGSPTRQAATNAAAPDSAAPFAQPADALCASRPPLARPRGRRCKSCRAGPGQAVRHSCAARVPNLGDHAILLPASHHGPPPHSRSQPGQRVASSRSGSKSLKPDLPAGTALFCRQPQRLRRRTSRDPRRRFRRSI